MSNFPTFFTNDSGSAAGPVDYVRSAFDDITLPATANTGLTSSASTNPLGDFFSNSNLPRFGAKTLWIKDLVQIDDHSKWINNRPTYRVIFKESFPGISAYVSGNPFFENELSPAFDSNQTGQKILNLKNQGDAFGVTGVLRRVAFLLAQSANSSQTAQVAVDGVNGSTITFDSSAGAADNTLVSPYTAFVHAAANETNDLHDIRLTSNTQNNLRVVGLIVYFENIGANVECPTGTTYVDKSKIVTAQSASLALSSFGSSLGGVATYYMSQTLGYQVSAQSCSTPISIAQGSSGTNLLSVSTGHGASFPVGSGVAIGQGTSMYVGSVTSVSTDTLTVSPTLPFGITNAIYKTWFSSPTYSINASLMELAATIDFSNYANLSRPILDLNGRFAFWASNAGITAVSGISENTQVVSFLGASGFMQCDGYFSAAEVELYSNVNTFHATLMVNGTPGWGQNATLMGLQKKTVFSDAGPSWNSFVLTPGLSMGALSGASGIGTIGIHRIHLYRRSRDQGITFGALASIETGQAYTERTATNATLMALGNNQRVYADQLYLKGSWVRGITFTAAGGAFYFGASTNSVLNFQYYGKNFAILGTTGGGTLTVDGAGVALTFNAMQTVASEGFHTVQYTVGSGATAQIQAVDFQRTRMGIRYFANVLAKPVSVKTQPALHEIHLQGGSGAGSSGTDIRRFTTVISYTGTAIQYVASATNGDSFTIKESGLYFAAWHDLNSSQGVDIGLSVNASSLTTGVVSLATAQVLAVGTTPAANARGTVSWIGFLKAGDVVRAHTNGSTPDDSTANNVRFNMVKLVSVPQ